MVASPRPSGRVAVAVTKPAAKPRGRKHEALGPDGKKSPRQPVNLPPGYKPTQREAYMNDSQLEYFRRKLLTWREELVEESKQTIDNLREEVRDVGDEAERATRETENSLELRTRDRYRKLIGKIDKALRRVEDGEYGYCEETGEEIGLDRLEARPIATLCLDAQERWEHRQRQMGD
jgi:DnaK suppressor protein